MVETQTWLSVFKWINIVSALTIVALAIYQAVEFFTFSHFEFFKIWSIFTPVYMLLFGAMLISLEFKPEPVVENFQFLATLLGRGIFYIFLGSIASYQIPSEDSGVALTGWIWGLILWIVGMVFIVLNFTASDDALKELKQKMGMQTQGSD